MMFEDKPEDRNSDDDLVMTSGGDRTDAFCVADDLPHNSDEERTSTRFDDEKCVSRLCLSLSLRLWGSGFFG